MKIDIVTKNITLDDPLEVFIREKIGGLEKLISDASALARVEIGKPSKHHRSGPVFYAEANVNIGGQLIRAQSNHVDLRAAIVDVKDALKVEITKFKERTNAHPRRNPLKE